MPVKKQFGTAVSGQAKSNEAAYVVVKGHPSVGVLDENVYGSLLIPSTYFIFHQS
jgi:hypothetical protein